MKYLLSLAIIMVVLVSCDKDKFKTKPQIEIEEQSADFVFKHDSLVITLKWTDKEGDLSKGKLWYHVRRQNARPIPPPLTDYVAATSPLPEFPNHSTGMIDLKLSYSELSRGVSENDTINVRIAVTDRGDHASDTITTGLIIVERQ